MSAPGKLWPPLAALAVALLIWEVAVRLAGIQPWLAPTPSAVFEALIEHRARLARATLLSTAGALGGLAASLILGCASSLLFALSGILRRALYPWAVVLQTVPIVAIAPLIVIWIGEGLSSVVVVATIVSLFPIVTAGTHGLLRVRPELLELFAVHGASRAQVLWKLRVPHALPDVLVGARVAAGLAVVGTVVGELMVGYGAATASLGTIVLAASSQLDTALLFAAIILATLLGVAIVAVVGAASRAVLRSRGEGSVFGGSLP